MICELRYLLSEIMGSDQNPRVLPQMASIAIDCNMWGTLLIRLYQARESIPPEADIVSEMVTQFVESSVTADPFPVKKTGLTIQPNVDAIVDLVMLCMSTDNLDAYPKLFANMHSTFMLERAQREYRSTAYYIPLAKKLSVLKLENAEGMKLVNNTVTQLILVAVNSTSAFPTKSNTSEPDVLSIIELLQLCLSLNNEKGCSVVFGKMKSAFDRLDSAAKALKVSGYYIPLVRGMENILGARIQMSSFAAFYQVVANVFWDYILPKLGPLASPPATQVIDSVFKSSDPALLRSPK